MSPKSWHSCLASVKHGQDTERPIHERSFKAGEVKPMFEDAIMLSIQSAIATLQRGERDAARHQLVAIWAAIEHDPMALHECVLSHFMADTQDEVVDELSWDRRSLAAALRCTDAEVKEHHGGLSIAGFLPSLHLNLGDDYLRLGDRKACEVHLGAGVAASEHLPNTPYANMIRAGLEHLAEHLRTATDPI